MTESVANGVREDALTAATGGLQGADVLATTLETFLLPEDISQQTSVHCLSCKVRLGAVSYVNQGSDSGSPQVAVALALQRNLLSGFRRGPECVVLICQCGQSSTYHLL